ncbi:MAG: hypothetical protein H6739_04630 [Alphaproteobacteria bacterium]|nr:hypothetical protein [Alphaproteobacteria bacterium]
MSNLTPLGHARVYRDDSGELVIDTDSLRRGFAGDDFGDDYDDEDFDGDFEGDFDGDDDFEDDDDFGARGSRSRRKKRRQSRRENRRENGLMANVRDRREKRKQKGRKSMSKNTDEWVATAVGDSTTSTAAGAISLEITPQHDFEADTIVFTGSSSGAKVTTVFFADQVAWSNSSGLPVDVFSATNTLGALLKGQFIRGGLSIVINGTVEGSGDTFQATITGKKPRVSC